MTRREGLWLGVALLVIAVVGWVADGDVGVGQYMIVVITAAAFHGLHEGMVMVSPMDVNSTSTNYGPRFHKWTADYHMIGVLRTVTGGALLVAWTYIDVGVWVVMYTAAALWEVSEVCQNIARQGGWVYKYNDVEYEHVVFGWWGRVVTGGAVVVLHVLRVGVAVVIGGLLWRS